MPLKLVYFNVRGRAMSFRYMCLDNGIALEEQFVAFDEWPKVKPTTRFGQLPVVYDDGFEIAQSNAILRTIAKKHGLYGSNDKEASLIDQINDQQEDTRLTYLRMIYQEYDKEKDNYISKIPEKVAIFEKILSENNGGAGFFVGSKVSYVDYTVFDLLDNLTVLSSTCLDKFPLLKAFHSRMAAHGKIATYRKTDGFIKMPINGNGKQ
jgi:glutathione S-transferase P